MKTFLSTNAILLLLISSIKHTTSAPIDPFQQTPMTIEHKYFQEAYNYGTKEDQYDRRFYKETMWLREKQPFMRSLIHSYLNMTTSHNLETWLAHGTLLGWYWNKKMLPWDWDVDVQISWPTLVTLATKYNNTEYTYQDPIHGTKRYLLDVNAFYLKREPGQQQNMIDARWIDMDNGLFIDITGLYPRNPDHPNWLFCKNDHMLTEESLYPLKETNFEGVKAKVPADFGRALTNEYGEYALRKTKHNGYNWDENKKIWYEALSG